MLLSALLLLLLVAGRCSQLDLVGRSLKTRTETRTESRTETRTENRTENQTENRTENQTSRDGVKSLERQRRSHQRPERRPRDQRHKEKFLQHLTGPLNVNSKCRKHFYRLYHGTRDCTRPAYYRRCARLLTRLNSSARCAEPRGGRPSYTSACQQEPGPLQPHDVTSPPATTMDLQFSSLVSSTPGRTRSTEPGPQNQVHRTRSTEQDQVHRTEPGPQNRTRCLLL
ncbi:Protein FAM150B [Liparis tanakae]|uniref:Protein FAM150B n=1 Tax=Liparis tanakae TaxID=230148 RepID=A0A4Z2F2K7_9TELE|nr:Protein FAM150B [Liparis tanakae]